MSSAAKHPPTYNCSTFPPPPPLLVLLLLLLLLLLVFVLLRQAGGKATDDGKLVYKYAEGKGLLPAFDFGRHAGE